MLFAFFVAAIQKSFPGIIDAYEGTVSRNGDGLQEAYKQKDKKNILGDESQFFMTHFSI